MASLSLVEASKFYGNDIVTGIAETIVTTNPMFELLPFLGFDGDTLKINDESTLGDAGNYSIGDEITHKNPATYTERYFNPIKLIGDVELDELVRATSQSAGIDQTALQIASKAKSIARLFQAGMATGDGTAPNMNSMRSLCHADQQFFADGSGSAGASLSFELLDELLEKVKAKDGEVDFITMPSKTFRQYKALVRAQGGNTTDMIVKIPTSQNTTRDIIGYEGVPIFVNDFLDIAETVGDDTTTSIYSGVFDDGSRKIGIAGIYPNGTPVGIDVERIGKSHTHDSDLIRLRQYTNLMLGNERYGLSRLKGIK